MDYFVIDSRGNRPGAQHLDEVDEDWDRFVLSAGTATECCQEVNDGDYGLDCIVADENGKIMCYCFKMENGTRRHVPASKIGKVNLSAKLPHLK